MKELRNLLSRNNLLLQLTKAEVKMQYKSKVLGFLWAILDPVFLMITYWLLVSFIFNRGGENYAALLFVSIISWRWFLQSSLTSVKLFTSNSQLLQTVSFPLTILPLARNLLHSVNFLMGLLITFVLILYLQISLTWNVLWLLLIIPIQFVFNLAVSLIFAVVGVYLRDLHNVLSFALRLVFYLSPGLYQITDVPGQYQLLMYWINPFTSLFESYKNVLIYGTSPSVYLILPLFIGLGGSLIMFVFFSRNNRLAKSL